MARDLFTARMRGRTFKLGQTRYAKRDPIIIPGMDKKRAKITEAGLAFLRQQVDAAEGS